MVNEFGQYLVVSVLIICVTVHACWSRRIIYRTERELRERWKEDHAAS